jgi:hypothetical protein
MCACFRQVSKLALEVLLLAAVSSAPARAIPGQTTAQVAAWGKGNAALHSFAATVDDSTGGTTYIAQTAIDGHNGSFNSKTKRGVARYEFLELNDIPDAWNLAQHLRLVVDAIRTIYGATYVADFKGATHVPHSGRVTLWQGKKLAYATFGTAVFFFQNKDVPGIVKNMHACDALDCSEGDIDDLAN